ncbi:MAG: hypothetical protein RL662_1019 [Bacteroidota bacterium]|jgi:hypothetical protein
MLSKSIFDTVFLWFISTDTHKDTNYFQFFISDVLNERLVWIFDS